MSNKVKYIAPLVPEKCPICAAEWKGGSELPGKPMKDNRLVFYKCGAYTTLKRSRKVNGFSVVIKNCWCDDNIKVESGVDKIANPADFDYFSLNIPLPGQQFYYAVITEDGDWFYIEIQDNEAKIRYGDGVVPVFSTEDKAEEYKWSLEGEEEEENLKIVRMDVNELIENVVDWCSHVIVDPPKNADGNGYALSNETITDLTLMEGDGEEE